MKTATRDDERTSLKRAASSFESWVESRLFLGKLENDTAATGATDIIPIKRSSTVHHVSPSSIEYLKARGMRASLRLSNGEALDSTEPLYVLESKLDIADGFYKCHRKYIVNINHVHSFTSDEIIMRSGCRIPISRKCRANFKDAFFSVIFAEGLDNL